jgi:phage anti-repressor protein
MHYKKEENGMIPMLGSQHELLITGNSENILVDARLLHKNLKVQTKLSTWLPRRVEEFGFEENKDFYPVIEKHSTNVFSPILGKIGAGRKPIDYHLTLDMAKELAMLERSDIGRKMRQYFIAAEKEARRAFETGRMMPKGVKPLDVNGRRVYPFLMFAIKLGIKSGGSMYYRRKTYPNHFIKFDGKFYISEEMANLMVMQQSVKLHRANVIAMQPLLPFDFGEPILQLKGGNA